MKIVDVTATWLRCPIPPERQHTSDFGRLTTFDMTLVRVDTDEGITGFGEAKAAVGSAGRQSSLVSCIYHELRPILLGQDPLKIASLWEQMYSGVRGHFALEKGRVFPELGRRGTRVSAMSGVDLALWDIAGKALDVPVYRLMGGRCRDRVAAYASGGWAAADRIGAQLLETIGAGGFRAVKMRVGAMDGPVQTSVDRVRQARHALGDGVDLMADAHGTFDPRSARRFCSAVEEFGLRWLEEPVSSDDLAGAAEVRAGTYIPIAAGESLFTRFDFRDAIQARSVDILQPDPAITGGLTESIRIAGLASAHQLTMAPHLWGSALLFAAGLQLCLATPCCVTVEYSMGYNPMLRDLGSTAFQLEDGAVVLNNAPGLGVSVDEAFVSHYTYAQGDRASF